MPRGQAANTDRFTLMYTIYYYRTIGNGGDWCIREYVDSQKALKFNF